jgi:hypothetical protein
VSDLLSLLLAVFLGAFLGAWLGAGYWWRLFQRHCAAVERLKAMQAEESDEATDR